ncbi:MAG: aspartate aminotransferase family protein [Candidatus Omnitrophota bacterium]
MKKTMTMKKVKKLYEDFVLNTYTRTDLCLVDGRGAHVTDINGKVYLDFFPGWVVSGLGHRDPHVTRRLNEQMKRILHVSNNYYNGLQGSLAETIIRHSFKGKVFFGNSGAEANEAAIKLARKYGNPGRYEVITMEKSFHGRTLATIAATGQDKVKKGFEPLPDGFRHVKFNDIGALTNALGDKTVAVMIELVQGEGGINIAEKEYVRAVRNICSERDMLLIIDEVQTGIGRTGTMFGFQNYGIEPDVMTLAKSLGGGLPIGAMVAAEKYAGVLTPGTHASTFGGSPIVCAAALGVFDALEKGGLLKNALRMSGYFRKKLEELRQEKPVIKKIKMLGLMVGLELDMEDATTVYEACLDRGLLINCTQKNILRITPPLCVTKAQIDTAVKILGGTIGEKIK